MVPATALTIPTYLLLSNIGLIDTPLAVILPSLVSPFGLSNTYWAVLLPSLVNPFGVYLLRIYTEAAVPDDLLEAGRIDGAGETRIFFSVVLRLLTPGLVTVLLFQFVGIWNNYFLPLVMLSDAELYPITLGLNNWLSQVDRLPEFYELTTGGVLLSIIPLSIAMVVLQRFWRGGLTEGAVK
jgi:multiple sugar transport system permease protein